MNRNAADFNSLYFLTGLDAGVRFGSGGRAPQQHSLNFGGISLSLSLFFCVILRQKYHKGLTKAPSPSELRMSLRNKWHLDTSF